jgi:hypothetical protein
MSTDQINDRVISEPILEEPPSDNKRAKLLVIGAGVLAVLAAAAYFLFFAGGEAEPTPAAAPKPAAAPPAAEAPAAPVVPPVFNGTAGTDPFKPLVTEPEPAPEAAAGTATSGTGDTTTGTTSGTSQQLAVVSVTDDNTRVSVSVDGTAYPDLAVGQTFATFYKVYGIFGGTCAGFLYGDQSLGGCVGDTVTVTR